MNKLKKLGILNKLALLTSLNCLLWYLINVLDMVEATIISVFVGIILYVYIYFLPVFREASSQIKSRNLAILYAFIVSYFPLASVSYCLIRIMGLFKKDLKFFHEIAMVIVVAMILSFSMVITKENASTPKAFLLRNLGAGLQSHYSKKSLDKKIIAMANKIENECGKRSYQRKYTNCVDKYFMKIRTLYKYNPEADEIFYLAYSGQLNLELSNFIKIMIGGTDKKIEDKVLNIYFNDLVSRFMSFYVYSCEPNTWYDNEGLMPFVFSGSFVESVLNHFNRQASSRNLKKYSNYIFLKYISNFREKIDVAKFQKIFLQKANSYSCESLDTVYRE